MQKYIFNTNVVFIKPIFSKKSGYENVIDLQYFFSFKKGDIVNCIVGKKETKRLHAFIDVKNKHEIIEISVALDPNLLTEYFGDKDISKNIEYFSKEYSDPYYSRFCVKCNKDTGGITGVIKYNGLNIGLQSAKNNINKS